MDLNSGIPNSELLKISREDFPKELADLIRDEIKKFFQTSELYLQFSEKGKTSKDLEYLIKLSTNFACWILPPQLKEDSLAAEAHSIWLFLVYLIDVIFDQAKEVVSVKDQEDLIELIQELDQKINFTETNFTETNFIETQTDHQLESPSSRRTFLINSLFKTIAQGYQKYLELIRSYRARNPYAYEKILFWLFRYLKTLSKNVFENYSDWRLDSGAMMCVIWHLVLFTGIPEDLTNQVEPLFKEVALAFSYHNDLLSYHRDYEQGTPNLVGTFKGSEWSKLKEAFHYVKKLYREIRSSIEKLENPLIKDLLTAVLEGSLNWALIEERYSFGVKIIKLVEENRSADFQEIFQNSITQRIKVPGDF